MTLAGCGERDLSKMQALLTALVQCLALKATLLWQGPEQAIQPSGCTTWSTWMWSKMAPGDIRILYSEYSWVIKSYKQASWGPGSETYSEYQSIFRVVFQIYSTLWLWWMLRSHAPRSDDTDCQHSWSGPASTQPATQADWLWLEGDRCHHVSVSIFCACQIGPRFFLMQTRRGLYPVNTPKPATGTITVSHFKQWIRRQGRTWNP